MTIKKITIKAILLLLMMNHVHGQITVASGALLFEDTLSFQPKSTWITIPDSVNNIWEIGKPEKVYFDSGYHKDFAIITDSDDFYSNNRNDYFSITIPAHGHILGGGILSFYHKYDTDTLLDGGVIEISYDNGNSWINIRDDINQINTHFMGLYEGNISGGDYGFSGKSGGWQYVELYWQWLALVKKNSALDYPDTPIIRFRFVSDHTNTNKEGWMIDHVIFRGYDVSGKVESIEKNHIEIYPNPTNDFLLIKSTESSLEGYSLKLFDTNGKLVKHVEPLVERISIKEMRAGIYFYTLQKDHSLQTGKIIRK